MNFGNTEEVTAFQNKNHISSFVCLYTERGVEQLAEIISNRVQLAQYELLRESGSSLSWEEYVYMLAASEGMQERARQVAVQAQRDFSAFEFEHAQRRRKDGRKILAVRLFTGEIAQGMVLFFAFRAEVAHHRALKKRNDAYTLA